MKRYRVVFILLFCCFVVGNSWAQISSSEITINAKDLSWQQVADIIQDQISGKLYYNQADFDTLRFTINKSNSSLQSILNELFDGTAFQYSVYEDHSVFITREQAIITDLPAGFFNYEFDQEQVEEDIPVFMVDDAAVANERNLESRLFTIGQSNGSGLTGEATISGYVKDVATGEPIIGALVFKENPRVAVATNLLGFYSITLPKGKHELFIQSIGMRDTRRQIMLRGDASFDIELLEEIRALREIVIDSERDQNINSFNMGVEKLDIKTLKQIPTAFGETDVLKVALTLPGVQSVGESTTGLNVRGGSTDQNLILYNNATIYNPSHLFGFFSAFNPDVLKSVEIYKSGIPANYGGRLSSVLDIVTKDGNKKKFSASGGIGSLTTRLALEMPLINEKMSLTLSGRSTYSDWLLRFVPDESIQNSKASFYDLTAHLNYNIDERNSVDVTGYFSKDRFKLDADTTYKYQNKALSVKWKHFFNEKLFGVFSSSYSGYKYDIYSSQNPAESFDLKYNIDQLHTKMDCKVFPNQTHDIDFGVSSIYYQVLPGSFLPRSSESLVIPIDNEEGRGLETAVYVGDRIKLGPKLSVYLGLRYSMFNAMGPREIYNYADGLPREENSIVDTTYYGSGPYHTYHGPEYRASLRYLLGDNTSIKLSYNRMRQYIHMLSNTTSISPTDTWKLSDPNIRPQIGNQYAIGIYKNFLSSAIETSIEAYYKDSQNILDYKSGANLIANEIIETEVVPTEGQAYGVEVMIKKMKGKVNGWASYTYSRSFLRTVSEFATETINNGEYYPSNFDKPHDVTVVGNYKFNRRFNIGLNATYSTGRPITLPLAKYDLREAERLYYSNRNQYRIPDYFRLDLSINLEGNHKVDKVAHGSWTLAVYNLTGRRNAYSVYFVSEDGFINGYQLSVFGSPIPTITYNFKF